MSHLPRLLILTHTRASTDPRVFRQVIGLAPYFQITLAAVDKPAGFNSAFYPFTIKSHKKLSDKLWLAGNLFLGNSRPYLAKFHLAGLGQLQAQKFDLLLVNDANPLPLAFELGKAAPVVFDAHEYYPAEFANSISWNLLFKHHYLRLCHKYIPRCTAMLTVAPGLAEQYAKEFGITPQVIYSAPAYEDLPIQPLEPGRIRLIHHGGASRDRRLENIIAMMDFLDERFTLDLMLVGTDYEYISQLRKLSAHNPRVIWRDPVPMEQISGAINEYDLGVYLLPASNFNNANALPNKFFEFMQAGLGIAIGPSKEMARIVREHGLGVVTEDFEPQTMANALMKLTPEQIMAYKQNSALAAKIYNAQAEMKRLAEILLNLVNK